MVRTIVGFAVAAVFVCQAPAQTNIKYQLPPRAIADLIDVVPTPSVLPSPQQNGQTRWILIEHYAGLPPIAELAQPELRLAGLRFNPRTNGPSRARYMTALDVQALPDGKPVAISGLPANARIIFAWWAPDARRIAFVNVDAALSLWIADVATARARRVPGVALNGVFGPPCEWMSDSRRLVCRTVPSGRGTAPARVEVPTGPIIQENLGRVTPGATYEDLLKSPEDEAIFDYFASSQVELIPMEGVARPIARPGVITTASPSPDGNYVLISERHHPYSYLLPFFAFPERVSV